jgi:hypothetical protein
MSSAVEAVGVYEAGHYYLVLGVECVLWAAWGFNLLTHLGDVVVLYEDFAVWVDVLRLVHGGDECVLDVDARQGFHLLGVCVLDHVFSVSASSCGGEQIVG